MKTVTYRNRYSDQIKFEQLSETEIRMSGYSEHIRVGFPNLYSPAYSAYLEDCSKLEEPDFDLLVDDPAQNKVRELTLSEFKKAVHDYERKPNPLQKYRELIKSDHTRYDMIDPSGGPYIEIGTDLGRFFNGTIGKKYVTEIKTESGPSVKFVVSDTEPVDLD